MYSLPKIKHAESNFIFRKAIRIGETNFASEFDGSMQIYYVTANHGFASRNMQKGQSYKKSTM